MLKLILSASAGFGLIGKRAKKLKGIGTVSTIGQRLVFGLVGFIGLWENLDYALGLPSAALVKKPSGSVGMPSYSIDRTNGTGSHSSAL